jgi:polysaccharide pyruvyl transferase WcaK-like protein
VTTPPADTSMGQPRVVVLHAYDARNRGDELLVDESLSLLERAGASRADCLVVALRISTFSDHVRGFRYPGTEREGWARAWSGVQFAGLALGAVTTPKLISRTVLGRLISEANLIVGVGGAYLQARGGRQSAFMLATQLPQLALAAESDTPSMYLPQSVGPLRGFCGAQVHRWLGGIDYLAVRDDRTADEVAAAGPVRVPDLAVLAIARDRAIGAAPRKTGHLAVGIARQLEAPCRYLDGLRALDELPFMRWAVHSRAMGQDDGAFYKANGLEVSGPSASLLESDETGAAVSVRLHGALQALLAGIPTVHLTYERKGYGAFGDLGLTEWVHNARSFDPQVVAAQLRELLADPSRYWSCLEGQVPRLIERDQDLVSIAGRFLSLRA